MTQGCKQALHKYGRLRSMSGQRTLALALVEDHLECYRLLDIRLDRTEECRDPDLIKTERERNTFIFEANLEHCR